jgi:hypothetical protein
MKSSPDIQQEANADPAGLAQRRNNMKRLIRILAISSVLVVALETFGSLSQTKVNPRENGPLTLLYAYHCEVSARPKLTHKIRTRELKRLEAWKQDGKLSDFRVFFSRYADSDSPDLLIFLTFPSYLEVDRWRQVEARNPAALSRRTLREVSTVNTSPLDLLRDRGALEQTNDAVYLIIPYDFEPTSMEEYLKYFDGYVAPQLSGWMEEGILQSYRLYLQRYTAGRPWGSLLVLQYRDAMAFGAREKIVAKVRQELKKDPAWLELSERKQQLRKEKMGVLADEIH